jgi:hypothetical protein
MGMKLVVGLLTGTALCGLAIPACAGTLGIQLSESGFITSTLTGATDPLVLVQPFGTFGVNAEINTVNDSPLLLDLSSVNISTSTPGVLTVEASVSDLTSPVGLQHFISELTGHLTFGSGGTVSLAAYIDDSNTLFGTATLLDSSGLLSSPFSFTGSGSANLTSPFSLTEVLTIHSTGLSAFSIDASTTAVVPEASTWAMMMLGFAGLGFAAFRKTRSAISAA